jgi:hypothetical protein
MNAIQNTSVLNDRRKILSLLWIVAMFNYLYADVMTLMDPAMLHQIIAGTSAVKMSPLTLLAAAVLMETAIVMTLLSRILPYKANRITNVVAGFIHTLAVFSSMFAGKPAYYYLFCGVIEMAITSYVIWYAWTWKQSK